MMQPKIPAPAVLSWQILTAATAYTLQVDTVYTLKIHGLSLTTYRMKPIHSVALVTNASISGALQAHETERPAPGPRFQLHHRGIYKQYRPMSLSGIEKPDSLSESGAQLFVCAGKLHTSRSRSW